MPERKEEVDRALARWRAADPWHEYKAWAAATAARPAEDASSATVATRGLRSA